MQSSAHAVLARVRRYRPGCFSWCLIISAALSAVLVPAVKASRDAARMAQLT